jgi:CRISPR-associated protein Csx14
MSAKFKEIFIFIAGSTPQVITETIYALATKKPSIHPHEIHIITTLKGKETAKHSLIDKGILEKLFSEYSIPDVSLTEDSFHIPKDKSGKPLEDIKDEYENEIMGNLITSFIRENTKDITNRLHCSIAGGRKTMSFYLGSALQLFGRQWDKLYHVLVSPEFESNPDFFYKPRKNRTIKCNGNPINTKKATITLAELPFIRLRNKLSLEGKGFSELVSEGQREIDTATMQPQLIANLAERTLYIGDTLIEMVPVELMIYTAFLKQKTLHCKYPERQYCLDCAECFQMLADFSGRPAVEAMAKDYKKIYREQPLKYEEFLNKWADGIDAEIIRQNISKINRTLKEQLQNETLLPYYQVTTLKKYGSSRYGVRAEKGKVRIE